LGEDDLHIVDGVLGGDSSTGSQRDLFGGHLPGEHIRHQVDIGPLLQELGAACRSSGVVEEKVKDPVSS